MSERNFISRRSLLQTIAVGAGAVTIEPLLRGQTSPILDPVTARIQADLEKHASFGSKRSATPGDLKTAEWISERLRANGYKVASHDFPAPFLVERSVRLSVEGM
jgi:hypothetical protein